MEKILDKTAVIIGGSSGIGLSLAFCLSDEGYNQIIITGRKEPSIKLKSNIIFVKFDLTKDNIEDLLKYDYANTLIITAGIGRLAEFYKFSNVEIEKTFMTNTIKVIEILTLFNKKLVSEEEFNCCVVTSITGIVASPLYAVYSASKAALCKYIEAVNAEIIKNGSKNIITNVAPGYVGNTSFYGEETNVELLMPLIKKLILAMENKKRLYIPDYNKVYKAVISKYNAEPEKFALDSFDYKIKNRTINNMTNIKVGYLSGTFDLFHVGHLNLLERAKSFCDYLVVGVHKDASHKGKTTFISFEERKRIVAAVGVVDKVIESLPEDDMVWDKIHYNYLFVGSDYKGSERFKKYENYFNDKDVEIIYFPYTQGTSSTQLRNALNKINSI